ncbi:unnamed protein product, partial [Mesorhabditis belari]|uniref:Uncharacterized protein n=1 Tax=Mesorhabditis belari TaxID=2138241 RepID=A0AAF3ETD4_9BILA
MRLLIASSLCFCLVIAVPHRPGWRLKFEECYGTFECLQGLRCCTECPWGAICGAGTKYAPVCQPSCGRNDKEFFGNEPSYVKSPNAFCSDTYECPYLHVCCAMCPADAPCGPGTQFAPTCRRDCPPGDPNYRFFPEPVTLN